MDRDGPILQFDNVVVVGGECAGWDEGGSGGGRGGSIAERRAATCGFNAERIGNSGFGPGSPMVAGFPCLTISPGISPTALLGSPVLLPNSSPPSPTSGTLLPSLLNHDGEMLNSKICSDDYRGRISNCSFTCKSNKDVVSLPSLSSLDNQVSSPYPVQKAEVEYQPPASLELDFEFPTAFSKEAIPSSPAVDLVANVKGFSNTVSDNCCNLGFSSPEVASGQMCTPKENFSGEDANKHLLDCDQKGTNPSMEMITTSEDGYNWRKYGQKQVKGSEYPRSYYKCTHPNCPVKKKVERSLDGQVTEIIYNGAHNHPKPQPNRRALIESTLSSDEMLEMAEGGQIYAEDKGGLVWRNIQTGFKDAKPVSESSDWRTDGLERTSPTSVVTHASDPLSMTEGKSVGVVESAETPEFSSTLASHDDDNDDKVIQGSMPFFNDPTDDDESESKRRKTESCSIEMNLSSRAVREPRVVVQIESDVDILDDGYRWRKYGQKVVKGNPNPRSYYKCTSSGCSVRKHIERASDNIKCVLTTYEGKHNHEVPAARNSTSTISNTQTNPVLPRDTSVPKPGTQIPGIVNPFNRKPEFNNGYPRPTFLGNFSNEMKCGASPIYQMKFPPLHHVSPYSPFGPNSNCSAHPVSSLGMDFSIPLSLRLPQSANFPLSRFDVNNGKPAIPGHSFLQGQQLKENDVQFLRPKLEKKDDNLYDACYPIMDHANESSLSSSTVYHQVRGNFPP
ncbi:hypothetical protein SLEP1_g14829 [Rubroshorea leprosula]|uniref:WRKY domain-containing protein n=1 Tax=Rubroshorea leprosula TaxID=152421 RepID=A0AAV5IKF6_9ROSI|nr:hypothetical protein SLEP1_g14829 [Rubroshorea leprosula]